MKENNENSVIISGKELSLEIKDNLKKKIDALKRNNQIIPKLVVILVGNNPASEIYVRNKEKACEYVGMQSEVIKLKKTVAEKDLIKTINELNNRSDVHGILVQLPLPPHINEQLVINNICPIKDVDGFHPLNISKLFLGQLENAMVPCTPKGIIEVLNKINYNLDGKHVVVVGRSNIVGKPISLLCLQQNATVTIAHSHTMGLKNVCKNADVLICAAGQPKMFDQDYVKEGAVVIDVGINRDENNKLCGDVDFDDVVDIVSYITPVPNGIGPMTIAMLLKNTFIAYRNIQFRNSSR